MSSEMTDFEKKLAQLRPAETIDREQLIFAAGQANGSFATGRSVAAVESVDRLFNGRGRGDARRIDG